jgi:spore photoproduct lyase
MIDSIYFEESIAQHPRTKGFFKRFPQATHIPCTNYKEVFNPSGQSFRLQKKNPALILAEKKSNFALPIPETYGIGGKRNFYFSHLLNCLYDCRYCFLQGMYPSAHYVLFVNYEDFLADLEAKTKENSYEPAWFFSGYDCDSLALDGVSHFVNSFLPFFQKNRSAYLELRTKSVNIKPLLQNTPLDNVITAFSFTPQEISTQLEHGVPSVKSRIQSMKKLTDQGWQVGLRIDPLIDCEDFTSRYQRLFKDIFYHIPQDKIHSVSLGTFRMPTTFFKKMEKLYPEEKLFAGRLENRSGTLAYRQEIEQERKGICLKLLLTHIDRDKIYNCETASSTST